MELSATASIEIMAPRLEVFAHLTHNFPEYLDSWFIYPAVVSSDVRADQLAPGVGRTIGLSDGGLLDEEVRLHDPPSVHSYRWRGGVTLPNSLIVAAGAGIWRFEESGDGTAVTWTYTFELTSGLWWPVAKLMMMGYRHWMRLGLRKAKSQLEA